MEEEQEKGPARNIGELTLVCLELAEKISESSSEDEKRCLVKEHLSVYTENEVCMAEFDSGLEWFNVSRSLTVDSDLKGCVAVLDFFTYCCINCIHILPDLKALEELFPPEKGEVTVVGVHSAKFENERVSANILAAIEKYHIHHPVVNDANAKMWTELGIACWPTLLILGPNGKPLFVLVGEGHRERLQLYVDIAVEYFSELGTLTRQPIPLAPLQCVAASSILSYPGKVGTYPGGLIVADSGHNRILLLDKTGVVQKMIGTGKQGLDDGVFINATFNNPQGVAYHHPDTIFVADTDNHAIRQIDLVSEEVITIAGTGKQGSDLEGGKEASSQVISSPWDLCLAKSLDLTEDAEENVLVIAMAGTHQIWGIFLTDGKWFKGSYYYKGTAVRLAGSGAEENRNTSYPHKAGFAQPSGVTVGSHQGQPVIYVADAESSSIRKFSLVDGAVKGVVGAARDPMDLFAYGDVDGTGIEAKLQHPLGVSAFKESVYVADAYNHKVKLVNPAGKSFSSVTIAGNGHPGNAGGSGPDAQFNEPGGLCFSEDEMKLYIADTNNHAIKVFSPKENLVTEVIVKFNDESDSSSQDLLEPDASAEDIIVKVERGVEVKVLLRLLIDLAQGMSLNEEAPNKWKIETQDNCIQSDVTSGVLQGSTEVPLTISMDSSESPGAMLSIVSVMYVCLESGVCVKKNLKHHVRFLASDSNDSAFTKDVVDVVLNVKDDSGIF